MPLQMKVLVGCGRLSFVHLTATAAGQEKWEGFVADAPGSQSEGPSRRVFKQIQDLELVAVPDAAVVSDEVKQRIHGFVRGGGSRSSSKRTIGSRCCRLPCATQRALSFPQWREPGGVGACTMCRCLSTLCCTRWVLCRPASPTAQHIAAQSCQRPRWRSQGACTTPLCERRGARARGQRRRTPRTTLASPSAARCPSRRR